MEVTLLFLVKIVSVRGEYVLGFLKGEKPKDVQTKLFHLLKDQGVPGHKMALQVQDYSEITINKTVLKISPVPQFDNKAAALTSALIFS